MVDFGILKKYGRDFIAILKVMWSDYDAQTQEEFCEMNGIPISFKTIK
jgi:hypothetical protein